MRQGEVADSGTAAVRIGVLGPLRLQVDGREVAVPGPKRRAVLALLARAEGRVVGVDDLMHAVWPGESEASPDSARASLHSHISRLRGHLAGAARRLETVVDGYRLRLRGDELDAAEARALLSRARERSGADPAAACDLLRQARSLWRGAVLADLGEVAPIAAWTVSLDELRREIDDLYLSCALDAGLADEVVGAAWEAVTADPLREQTLLLLMRALAATGRTAEALRHAYDFRRRLADETGLDPTDALSELERRLAGGVSSASSAPAPPRPLVHLLGRESELAALHRLTGDERLVTVVGPGGVGKTSVVLELARQLPRATVLKLAPVTDPRAVAHALATELELRVVRGDVLTACAALLAAGPRVLVVDNCEHLRDAVRELISTLLERCPQLTVLATSREPLGLMPERQLRLAPLPLPDPGGGTEVARVPSVAVFIDRAQRVRDGFTPDAAGLRLVSDIVRRLDGVPLAIELAAGRLSSMGLTELHERLDRALDLLGDSGAAGTRHRTLRATIEWSYHLLNEAEQRLFRHLSIMPDGFDLATAERIAHELGLTEDPAGVVARLVDASMLDAQIRAPTRYRMLDTLRAFGFDRLADAGERKEAEDLLVRWAVDLARWIGDIESTEREPEADAAVRRELGNLRAAWALGRAGGRFDEAVALVSGLLAVATARDLTEVWRWASELAADPDVADHPRRAVVLGMAATAAWQRADLAEAEQLARRGLASVTDEEGRWWCLSALANTELSGARFDDASGHALAAARSRPRPSESYAIAALAAAYGGDLDRARGLNDQLGAMATSATLQALHAYTAGEIDNVAREYAGAEEHYARAISLAKGARSTFIEGIAAVGLVTVQAAAGRTEDALRGYRRLIDYWQRTGMWLQQWTTLRNLARLLHQRGDHAHAGFLQVAADHAPDAPAVGDQAWPPDPVAEAASARVRAEAASATRSQVLQTARQAIDQHLAQPAGHGRRAAASNSPSGS